ncbi:MAG: cell division protein ZapA [Defluviitaleaceae bacterium]|nr:cell division protein ZapA [Defluviitaleaceae bacterium]
MTKTNKVDVVICGEVITLKSNEEEAHLQRIARYIDRKLVELSETNASASINERVRTLLIALNVADDYFKASDSLARTKATNEKYVHELGRMQQEYAMLKEKFHEMQAELALTKAKLDSFVAEYEKHHAKDGANVLPLFRKINTK